ncbi:MAG: ABC transporter permease subunit [Proteobacteria bacterium]|nr:ABC transporter permease subunit [Pseudomonadota bacterium]
MSRAGQGSAIVRLVPLLWLILFFLFPFLIVFKISLSESAVALPPYLPHFNAAAGWDAFVAALGKLSTANFTTVFADDLLWGAYGTSLRVALLSTLLALVLGLTIALPMARAPRHWQPWLVTLVVLPFLTSFLIRAYAWMMILKPEGLLNGALMGLGLISEPLVILHTETAVIIGIVYSYLPFMVLPLYASLEAFDASLTEAAQDLGATPTKAFFLVTAPVIAPAIAAGSALVFIPALGEFVVPDLLGGAETLMIGRVLWTEFFANRDWPLASAMAILLLLIVLVPILWRQRARVA